MEIVRTVSLKKGSPCKALPDDIVLTIHRCSRHLGNPAPMKNESEEERTRVIEVFREVMAKDLKVKGPIYRELQRVAYCHVLTGRRIALECWCAPKRCHGDLMIPIIMKFIVLFRSKLGKTKGESNA